MNKRIRRRGRSKPVSTAPPRQVIYTIPFRRTFSQLPIEVQRSVQHKIAYLATDPRHPSLHVHRLRARPGTWICTVSRTYRLFYQCVGRKLILCDVGMHRATGRMYRG
jgi:hypothetical protein